MKTNKGYTLMEMIVVLGILSMVMGIGIGSVYGIQRYTFNGLTAQLKEQIQLAQQEASLTNGTYVLKVASQAEGVSVQTWKGSKVVEEVQLPQGIQVTIDTIDGTASFQGDMSPAKAFTMTIKHTGLKEKRRLTVRVATGKITLYHD